MGFITKSLDRIENGSDRAYDIANVEGVNNEYEFTDNNGMFHQRGYKVKNGDGKILKTLIERLIEIRGSKGNFNDIDVSNITDMSYLFHDMKDFNGDISGWDVSNVDDMSFMFYGAKAFNVDISKWNVSNVDDMFYMFYGAEAFNKDFISRWDVSNVDNKSYMFEDCPI